MLYTLLIYIAAPLASIFLLSRGFRDRRYWKDFAERFGFGPFRTPGSIWVHAASVGEVQAAAPFVFHLRKHFPQYPVVLTTFSPLGTERARVLFKDDVHVRYLPFDLPGSVRRFFRRIQPRLAVIFETEVWPSLYRECAERGIPLVLASARITPRSVRRFQKLAGAFQRALSKVSILAAQSEADAARFRSVGANPAAMHVMGNIKFDYQLPADVLARAEDLRQRYTASRLAWIAGSTHDGEEQAILTAHRSLYREHGQALLILVPRHPRRFAEVADWLAREGVRFTKRSSGEACSSDTEVLLVDSLGELVQFYALADVAYVGGSLVPVGGHNLLEPAALGLPVLSGPHTSNSEGIARILIEQGALKIVRNAEELRTSVSALFRDSDARARIGRAARATVESNRGALDKLVSLIDPLLNR